MAGEAADQHVVHTAEIHIDAPVETVIGLLDLSAPTNRLLARGFDLAPDAKVKNRFHATHADLPVRFQFDVLDRQFPQAYSYTTRTRGRKVSHAKLGRTHYTLHREKEESCGVVLEETTVYPGDTLPLIVENEARIMALSVRQDLEKLKLQAEDGGGAVPWSTVSERETEQIDDLLDGIEAAEATG
ncbi:MAG: hypothetical protein AAFQ22_08325 [Pseudomonadota bacterium]